MPSTAALVKEAIGNTRAFAMDIAAACSGLRLRLVGRSGLHRQRDGPQRPGHRRRAPDPVPGLLRPEHLHPVRRRRRGRGPVGSRRARWRPRHRADDRAPGRVHDLAPGRWREEPAVGGHGGARRALHPDGGSRDLPVRDPDPGQHGPRRVRKAGLEPSRHRPVHPAPGEHPDHPVGRRRARPADGPDVREPRQLREHVGRLDPDRPRRGGRFGPGAGRRPDRDRRLRGRASPRARSPSSGPPTRRSAPAPRRSGRRT